MATPPVTLLAKIKIVSPLHSASSLGNRNNKFPELWLRDLIVLGSYHQDLLMTAPTAAIRSTPR
jgi:hypothetical protein